MGSQLRKSPFGRFFGIVKYMDKITCKTGLKRNIIKKDLYEREIVLCKKLFKENKGGCNWGRCKECGAPLLLYKLYKGQLIEKPDQVKKFKNKILK